MFARSIASVVTCGLWISGWVQFRRRIWAETVSILFSMPPAVYHSVVYISFFLFCIALFFYLIQHIIRRKHEDLFLIDMIDPEDNQDTSLIHRTTEIKPSRNISQYLIGRPLPTADAAHETIGKAVGLAVFASDALSSTAYATQEILVILAAAGTIALGYVFPISIVIVGLLAIVVISYEQIIHTYPQGGGAYIVASDNLGKFPALFAADALLIEYILTVSVSISAGVAQIVSAYPQLFQYRVLIALLCVV